MDSSTVLYKIAIHVPESHVEQVKQAAFDAGAGRQGKYEHCAFQWLGEGQFKPLAGSNPYSGEHNRLSRVAEYRVEMICQASYIKAAVAAIRDAHPYEEAAIDVWRLESI